MTLLLATRNPGKIRELRRLLTALGVSLVTPDEVGLPVLAEEDDIEGGETFAENALAKAQYFCARSGLRTLADDSGLEVAALDGAPGVRSRRFAGVDGPDTEVFAANNRHLLELLRGVPTAERGARFRCVLAVVGPDGEAWTVDGVTEGRILAAPDGVEGFGYDPLFYSEELRGTFAACSVTEKGRVSHRGRAAAALVERFGSPHRPV